MDAFMKRVFRGSAEPVVRLGELDAGMVHHAYANAFLKVETASRLAGVKPISLTQPMTLLGRSSAHLVHGPACLTGLSKAFLTPDGLLRDLETLVPTLRSHYADPPSYHQIISHLWRDNHVSLIVNCLRYSLIQRTLEQNPNPLSQSWPDFNDGVVTVDRNQWWPADYPSPATWTRSAWPGGDDAQNYPTINTAPELGLPTSPDCICFLDLRGLSIEQSRFIILMLGKWNRRSRMLLDFSLPMLADSVVYRACFDAECLIDWNSMPIAPTADEAWFALTGYVVSNRVYDHFSTALHIVTSVMYQMLPVTAEGQYWLSLERHIKLPTFASVRGRYAVLLDDEAGFIGSRSKKEWKYIIFYGSTAEKVYLIAMVFAQAAQTGLAVRALCTATETRPVVMNYYNRWGDLHVAASEAVGFEMPDSGMSDVYVTIREEFGKYSEERVINITSNDATGLRNYTTVTGPNNTLQLKAPWFVLPGIPTLVLPINPFPTNSPFVLKGEIKADDKDLIGGGHRVKADLAWEIANLCHMCGYRLAIESFGEFAGHKAFDVPDDVAMMWPLYFHPEKYRDLVFLKKMTEGQGKVKIELPSVCSYYFSAVPLKYEAKIFRRGVECRRG